MCWKPQTLLLPLALAAMAQHARATDVVGLAAGEIFVTSATVPNFKEKQIHVEAVINAKPERVWAIVSDCANFKKTMPTISESELVSRQGNVFVCRSTLDLTWPLPNLIATTRVVQTVVNGSWRAEWTLVSGDYKYNQGQWNLSVFEGDPGRTFVVYEVLVSPTIVVPDALTLFGKTQALPNMIRGLRAQLGAS